MKLENQPDYKKQLFSTKSLAIMALFIALSFVGAFIKIPSPVGSIGLDSFPGFFAAIAYGPLIGGIVIAIGHFISAAVVGFAPIGIPMHLLISLGMIVCGAAFWFLGHKKGLLGLIIASVVAIVLNSFGVGLLLLPLGGWGMYLAVMPMLVVASAINVILAALAYFALKDSKLLN